MCGVGFYGVCDRHGHSEAVWDIGISPARSCGGQVVNCCNRLPLRSTIKKGIFPMQIIIAVIAVFGAAGIIILSSTLDMGGVVKAVVVSLAVLFAVYSMARIHTKDSKSEKETNS